MVSILRRAGAGSSGARGFERNLIATAGRGASGGSAAKILARQGRSRPASSSVETVADRVPASSMAELAEEPSPGAKATSRMSPPPAWRSDALAVPLAMMNSSVARVAFGGKITRPGS